MRITRINEYNYQKYYNIKTKSEKITSISPQTLPLSKYSVENIKANYLPSFSATLHYKKAGTAFITNKDTLMPVLANIRKTELGNYTLFSLTVDKKEEGFLVMKCDEIYPVAEHVIKLPSDNIPKITHFRSINSEEKYSGIGTALLKTAIQESYNKGCYGNLWLFSSKGYEKKLSKYRSNTNPIPFYYKMGFKSPIPQEDAYIRNCLKNQDFDSLPKETNLILTQRARKKWLKELEEDPIIKFKKPVVI